MAGNKSLNAAIKAKNNEFYTRLEDIENELKYYNEHFKGKVVLCNCDDPRVSNFFHYFSYNFEKLGIKKLITTCYKSQERDLFSMNKSNKAIYLIYEGDKNGKNVPDLEEIGIHQFKGDGDFRSYECIELLKQADIVVTNPPFSLFREYVAQLIEFDKKFLIIGNQNAIHYKEIFPLVKKNEIWTGYTYPKLFRIPDNADGKSIKVIDGIKYQQFGNICWYTNLDIKKRHENLILYKNYNELDNPRYDNFDAIECCPTTNIPCDYDGLMGVPITFFDKYNPEQFEIIGILNHGCDSEYDLAKPILHGKEKFTRIIIRRKQQTTIPMAAEPIEEFKKE
ncbi:MAG: adenine-specific methyltransferase EcoRI family protein [Bacteroidales bacterium]|nr:adenine-specific methyltransferase EcoRI family protein [Bacteroidales bacterium]